MGLGRLLVSAGLLLVAAGLVIMLLGRFHVPLGRLPGDITYRGRSTTVYFPWVTCIVISVVGSVILWLINRLR